MKNRFFTHVVCAFAADRRGNFAGETGLIGNALISTGCDVKLSEVHGMSQRGGSVVTYVKYGDKVHSPLIDLGEADYILSFEALEAGRFLPYLKKGGTIITNTQHVLPMPVITGQMAYPETVLEDLKAKANVIAVDALSLAEQAGSPKAVNVVLTGVLSKAMDLPEAVWQQSLETTVPPKFLELNKKAFRLGRES